MAQPKTEMEVLPPKDAGELRQHILQYLETHNVMTIASCSRDVPWVAATETTLGEHRRTR